MMATHRVARLRASENTRVKWVDDQVLQDSSTGWRETVWARRTSDRCRRVAMKRQSRQGTLRKRNLETGSANHQADARTGYGRKANRGTATLPTRAKKRRECNGQRHRAGEAVPYRAQEEAVSTGEQESEHGQEWLTVSERESRWNNRHPRYVSFCY